ncbi:MAG TPA: alginate lyase family protein [Tepidisphaeraceae bacterium]|jgi:uncharacterized heparinase superfamily protein
MSFMRFLHTVRHLRPQQIVGQVVHRVRGAWDDPAKVLTWPAPPYSGCAWRPVREFVPPPQSSGDVRSGQWTFLNRTESLGWPPRWETAADVPELWQYNLHYFNYLWSLSGDDARRLALDWIERHPPCVSQVGWEPYPTSLRVMNWCCVFFGKFRDSIDNDIPARDTIWWSIYRQMQWLTRRLETHLLGNHLLENAAALVVAGSCFEGDTSRGWYEKGLQILRQQLPEQILPDGGHFERSPMYQCRVMALLTLLATIGRKELDDVVQEPLWRTLGATKLLCHPDGKIALLNDSAFGVYEEPELRDPPVGAFSLPQTGYFGARGADGSYIICDAGPIGPDYLPGHAHGDMLSFELSVGGRRVIVDSGVYDYEAGAMRDYCRSTRAHNTIEIAGEDQCEFWGAFRVGRRGTVRDVQFDPRDNGFTLRARHDGYMRLPCRAFHQRCFTWRQADVSLTIEDEIISASHTAAVSRLHLHPDAQIIEQTTDSVRVRVGSEHIVIAYSGAVGELVIEDSLYCPEFGIKLPNKSIAWKMNVATRMSLVTLVQRDGSSRQ